MSDGGKGSGRRPGSGYQEAWERIFGSKPKPAPEPVHPSASNTKMQSKKQ